MAKDDFYTVNDRRTGSATTIRKNSKYGDIYRKARDQASGDYERELPDAPKKLRDRASSEYGATLSGVDATVDAKMGKKASDRERTKYAK